VICYPDLAVKLWVEVRIGNIYVLSYMFCTNISYPLYQNCDLLSWFSGQTLGWVKHWEHFFFRLHVLHNFFITFISKLWYVIFLLSYTWFFSGHEHRLILLHKGFVQGMALLIFTVVLLVAYACFWSSGCTSIWWGKPPRNISSIQKLLRGATHVIYLAQVKLPAILGLTCSLSLCVIWEIQC
jgi:hypothetical protein